MPITATIEFQCDYCGVIARQPYTDAARPRMTGAGWIIVQNDIYSDSVFCPDHRDALDDSTFMYRTMHERKARA